MRVRKVASVASVVIAIAIAITIAACACSPGDDAESHDPNVFVQSTQFAPPPAPITDLVPTAEQLTALYNATTNYSIRDEDRARLLEGPSDQTTLRIARAWGALPTPQLIQFTTVEPVGPDMINATGRGRVVGMDPYPVGPISFVRSDNEWKLSRTHVCDWLAVLPEQNCD